MWTELYFPWSPFPGLFDHFIIAYTNLTSQITDFQGTCDPCHYSVLLLRPPVWKHLALLGAESYEYVWERGRALAPCSSRKVSQARGYSLACLSQGPRPESESLSLLCLSFMWIEALLMTIRFLRTQTGNCRIWSDWKCNRLLPLVVLTVSGSEEVLQWLLFQPLRYSFCGICGNELKDWP